MAKSKDDFSSQVRNTVEKNKESAEAGRQRQLLGQRLDIARAGAAAAKKHQVAEAAQSFHTYLKLLEELKNVDAGGLMPSHFQNSKDVSELLMVSGVYWDLARLYDRTQSDEKKKEFLHYLEKYIIFSKGMPFQALCAENLRKYINQEKPVHLANFKEAHRMLSSSRCFVVTSLVEVTSFSTLPTLRAFRDQVLKQSPRGRNWVAFYYRKSHHLVKFLDHSPNWFRSSVGLLIDFVAVIMMQKKRK